MGDHGLPVLDFYKDRGITVGNRVVLEDIIMVRSAIITLQGNGRDAASTRDGIVGLGDFRMSIDRDMVKKNVVGQIGRSGADFRGIARGRYCAIADRHVMGRARGILIGVALRFKTNPVIAGFNVQIFERNVTPTTNINAIRPII